jgi:heat shock protein HslJ
MKETRAQILLLIIGIILLFVGMNFLPFPGAVDIGNVTSEVALTSDYRDATYVINGEMVTLKDGLSETTVVPGSASKVITRYFGNEVKLDLNEDGMEDVVFLLTQETGGSGLFYYVVAALNTGAGYVGSEGLLLGDRIAPQTTEVSRNPSHKNVVVVNYAIRNPGEPMTTQPSLGKSIWIKLDLKTMQFGEVVQNFEGEADPARMTLGMKKWVWISTIYNDGKVVTPGSGKVFNLTLNSNGTFSAKTDCNGVGGEYTVKDNKISFERMMSTMMYCEGSQEQEFAGMMSEIQNYHFTSKGELIFGLKFDSGSFIFR